MENLHRIFYLTIIRSIIGPILIRGKKELISPRYPISRYLSRNSSSEARSGKHHTALPPCPQTGKGQGSEVREGTIHSPGSMSAQPGDGQNPTGHGQVEWQLLNPFHLALLWGPRALKQQRVNETADPCIPFTVTGLAHCKPLPCKMAIPNGTDLGRW